MKKDYKISSYLKLQKTTRILLLGLSMFLFAYQGWAINVGNFVWNDLNNNGIQDPGEPGIKGVIVTIEQNGVKYYATTDADGYYYYHLPYWDLQFCITFGTPGGNFVPSPANVDSNSKDDIDSDYDGSPICFLATSAADNYTFDAGFFNPGSIGDFVWNDLNNNGVQDGGEPGIEGVKVTLEGCGITMTDFTDANGLYLFENLIPCAEYCITFGSPGAGFVPSPVGQGGDVTKDSDGPSVCIPLAPGENNLTIDAGYVTCGECEGQIIYLALKYTGDETDATIRIYQGKVEDDKLFQTFDGVNNGDILSFTGSEKDNKMGSKIFLTVNGDDNGKTEIHTSCSQDIFAGQYWGEFLIIAGESKDGGPLCALTPPDEEECGECEGQIISLALKYTGDVTNATIRIYQGKVEDDKLFQTFDGVNNGDILSFTGSEKDNKMGSKIFLTVNGDDNGKTEIHTSCSQDIFAGQYWGEFLIIAGESKDGGPLCALTPPDEEECGECEGQIISLALKYTGDETDATIRIYQGKVEDDKLFQTFEGVNNGDILSFTGSEKDNKMGSKIFLTVNGDDNGKTEIHTSCSQDIFAGQYWGEFLIIAGESKDGGPLCALTPPDEEECGECEGQIISLALKYTGDVTNATIRIYQGKVEDDKLFQTFDGVNNGDILSFTGSEKDNKMGSKIFLTVNGDDNGKTEIHTSCSQDIFAGQYWGEFLIIAGESKDGGPLCDTWIKSAFIGEVQETLDFKELKVYPNPFSEQVTFEFVSGADTRAVLEINNMLGQKVTTTLMDGWVEKGVMNRVQFNPMDNASGIYIYKLTLDGKVQTGKVIYKEK